MLTISRETSGIRQLLAAALRSSLPPLKFVQSLENSLAEKIGVAMEASSATVPGDDQFHTHGGNQLTLPPMDLYGPPKHAMLTSSCVALQTVIGRSHPGLTM